MAPRADAPPSADGDLRHWHANLRLTAVLLAVLVVATFVVPYFARELDVPIFGWHFSFWMAAQGAPLIYGGLVAWYVRAMRRLDEEHGVAEVG